MKLLLLLHTFFLIVFCLPITNSTSHCSTISFISLISICNFSHVPSAKRMHFIILMMQYNINPKYVPFIQRYTCWPVEFTIKVKLKFMSLILFIIILAINIGRCKHFIDFITVFHATDIQLYFLQEISIRVTECNWI